MKKLLSVLIGIVLSLGAWGGADDCSLWPDTGLRGSDGEIRRGEWNSNFYKAKEYAEAHNVPMLLFWANYGCDHCEELEKEVQSPAFLTWQKQKRLVMAFAIGFCSEEKDAAFRFARDGKGLSYPVIRVYWPKKDGSVLTRSFMGRLGSMPSTVGKTMDAQLMNSVDAILGSDYKPYTGGEFAVGDTVGDRLEAQVGLTTFVDVPLTRDESSADLPAQNTLAVTINGKTTTLPIAWTVGMTKQMARVDLSSVKAAVGQTVVLALKDVEGGVVDERKITFVNRGNSPKNPLWVKTRTADELAWGEWTMDLEAAQTKAADFRAKNPGEKAYVLASVVGSMWCPDCARTERHFVDTPAFKAWATENRVACVAIDIPTDPTVGGPSLLSREPKEVSAKYIEADPEKGPYQSGAGYLSRWMISDEEAATVAARNAQLVGVNTLNGGWNRPERANQKRTGVPIFVLLKADGSIAGRIETLAYESPSDGSQLTGFLRRMDELLATAEKPAGEADIHPLTTTANLPAKSGTTSVQLTGADAAMCYKLTGVESYATLQVKATGKSTVALAHRVTVFARVGDTVTSVATAAGDLSKGVAVSADFSNPKATYFARVEIDGLTTLANFAQNTPIVSDVTVTTAVTYKRGTVAFVQSAQTVFVPDGSAEIEVVRQGGVFGPAAAKVVVSSAGTVQGATYSLSGADLMWAAGETGVKRVKLAVAREGQLSSGSFVLGLQALSGNEATIAAAGETVTLTDTTKPCFEQFDVAMNLWSTLAAESSLALRNVNPKSSVTLKKVSGALPSGIKLAYDRKTGGVLLSGTCRKPGVYEVTYVVKQGGVEGLPTTFRLTIADPKTKNPFVGRKRDKQQIALLAASGATELVAGQLTVSITAANKITAKFEGSESKTLAFSGAWSDITEDGRAVAILKRDAATLALEMDRKGALAAIVTGATSAIASGELTGFAEFPETDYADWAGVYNVTLVDTTKGARREPTGTGFVLLTVRSNGKVSWKGYLSNGTSVSGSSQLIGAWIDDEGDAVAAVPLYKRASKDVFTALLEIKANGDRWTDDQYAQMVHVRKGTAAAHLHREAGYTYLLTPQAYGAWYQKSVTPAGLCEIFGYDKSAMTLRFDVSRLAGSEKLGAAQPIGETVLAADGRGFKAIALADGVKFAFAQTTGQISGQATLRFSSGRMVNGKYMGVLLPGWSGCSACASRELIERPFASGTFYFKDTVGGRSVTRSLPVDIEVKAAIK